MRKEEFLKTINDNIKDFNKKVKFIFTSPYSKIECYLTSAKLYKNIICLSNYCPPKLDENDKHLACGMMHLITQFTGEYVSFVVYFNEIRNKNHCTYFLDYKMTVNETDNFIELIIQE